MAEDDESATPTRRRPSRRAITLVSIPLDLPGHHQLRRRRHGAFARRPAPGLADRPQRPHPQPGAGHERARPVDLLRHRVRAAGHQRPAVLPARLLVRRRRGRVDGAPHPHVGPDAAPGRAVVQQGRVPDRLRRPEQLHLPLRRGVRHVAARLRDPQRHRVDVPAVAGAGVRARLRGTDRRRGRLDRRQPHDPARGHRRARAALDRPRGPVGRDRGRIARPPRRGARGGRRGSASTPTTRGSPDTPDTPG